MFSPMPPWWWRLVVTVVAYRGRLEPCASPAAWRLLEQHVGFFLSREAWTEREGRHALPRVVVNPSPFFGKVRDPGTTIIPGAFENATSTRPKFFVVRSRVGEPVEHPRLARPRRTAPSRLIGS